MADILERFDFDDKPGLDKLKNLGTTAEDVGKEFRNLGDEAEKAVKKTVEKSVDLDDVFGKIGKTVGTVAKFAATVAGAATVAFGAATAAGVKLASQNDRIAEQQEGLTKKWGDLRKELSEKLAPAVYALQQVFGDFLDKGIKQVDGLSSGFAVNLGASIIAVGKTAGAFFDQFKKRISIVGLQLARLKIDLQRDATFDPFKKSGLDKISQSLIKATEKLKGELTDLSDVYDETFTSAQEKLTKLVKEGFFEHTRATEKEIEAIIKLRAEYEKFVNGVQSQIDALRVANSEGIERLNIEQEIANKQIKALEEEAAKVAVTEEEKARIAELFERLKFETVKNFENKKTQLLIEEEKARRKILIDSNKAFFSSLEKIQTLEDQNAPDITNAKTVKEFRAIVRNLELELQDVDLGFIQNFKDEIFKTLGISREEGEELFQGLGQVLAQFQELFTANIDRRIAENDRLLDSIRERTNTVESELQRELGLQEVGRENNVKSKQEELKRLAKEEADAEKEREKLEKKRRNAQLAADTVERVSALTTAAANAFQANSKIPIIGIILGIAAVAALFAAFNSAKAKASSAAKPQRLYKGGTLKGKVKKDSGYVNWLYPKSDVPGRGEGHRIADSDIVVGGREMVVAEGPANSQSDRFWDDMNSGKYNDVDIASSLDDHNTNQAKINQGFAERKATIVSIQRKEKASQALTEEATERIMNGVADKMIKYLKQRPQFIVTDKDTETITKWSEAKEDKQNLRAIS